MSTSDWEEIKRLAADFQRAQLSSGIQKLSERNCIEIINKLIESKGIDVVFTTDGKEYITPQHLIKEIKDELIVHQGRINLVELAKILSVDFSVISLKASEIERSSSSIFLVNGQLINDTYINYLCDEINEKLKLKGRITIADITSQFDLPSDFLVSIISKNLGKSIKAEQDIHNRHAYFTEVYKNRNISLVKGGLLALTKPIPVSNILNLLNIEEHLFYFVLNHLSDSREIGGSVSGKEGTKAIFTPAVYIKSQLEWVKNFYAQNGYLEYNALSHIGISNPVKFIEKNLPDSQLFKLFSCAVGPIIFDQVEAAIEDVISTATFIDILPILPTVAHEKDAELILTHLIKKKSYQNLHIFTSSVIVTDQYLRRIIKIFDDEIEKRANECVSSGTYLKYITSQGKNNHRSLFDNEKFETKVDKKEERRKKAAEGKGGGGTQGRETKTKSTKKKYGKAVQNDDNYEECDSKAGENNRKLEVLYIDTIKQILSKEKLLEEEDSEELIDEISEYLFPKLNTVALEKCKAIYESTITVANQDRRKKHNELQDKLNDLVLKVRLFDKGSKQFTSKDVQQQLSKYLLKSICTDIAKEIFICLTADDGKFENKEMTPELRNKIANSFPADRREALIALNKSLISSSLDEFLNIIDHVAGTGFCDILLKKADKKKERLQLLEQRQRLIDHINVAEDSALVLHLAVLIIFQEVTQTMLHASGKFVSIILSFLQSDLPVEIFTSLQQYHDLVLKVLTTSDPEEKLEVENILFKEMPSIKEIAIKFKKFSGKPSE